MVVGLQIIAPEADPTNVGASVRQRLCCAQRAMVKDQKLIGLKRQLRYVLPSSLENSTS